MNVLSVDDTDRVFFAVEDDRINVHLNDSLTPVDFVKVDGIKIQRDLNRVVAAANAKVLALDYSTDFKGKKSLNDAYIEIDQIITKAIVDLAQVYYNDVISLVLEKIADSELNSIKDEYANTNGTAPTGYSYTNKANVNADAAYYKADNDFYLQAEAILTAAKKALTSVEFKSYDDLNKIENKKNGVYNISEQKLFDVVESTTYPGTIGGIKLHIYDSTNADDKGSSFETILKYAFASMNSGMLDFYKTSLKVDLAEDVHQTAIEYAKRLDNLVGIAKDNDASKGFDVPSALITDFGASYKAVVGDDNYKVNTVYQNLVAARNTARTDILSVKLLNDDGSFAIDKETYAAMNSDGKAWYTENKNLSTFGMTTTAKNNVAVQVVVDPEVVAEYVIISKFAAGADAVVLKFCDATRAIIKSSLNADLTFYGEKYFGDLDHVKLEADMKAYIEFLNSLTDFAGIGAGFKTASFSLKNQALDSTASGTTVVMKKNGNNYSYVAHVNTMDKNVDDITGLTSTDATAWYTLTKGNLTTYFSIKNGDVVSDGLKLVKQLSYKKDMLKQGDDTVTVQLVNNYSPIDTIYKTFTGTVKDGKFTVNPVPAYALGTQHTALYLSELAKVKERVINKVTAVDLINSGVKAGKTPAEAYTAALAALDKIMAQTTNTVSDGQKAAKSVDDYSFYIAWARYYTDDPALAYDWTKYKG